ncbi:MAG: MazG-like family protein [bacterium]
MKQLEERVLIFLEERGWNKLRPSDLAKSISIEAAELLEIFQWDSVTLEEVNACPEKLAKLKKELADVLIYALELSVLMKLDTKQIILEKLDHADKKYPAEVFIKFKDSDEKGNSEYLQIKEEYRRQGLS